MAFRGEALCRVFEAESQVSGADASRDTFVLWKVQQMPAEFSKHAEQIKKHATSVLNRAANMAKQAGVSCETIQVEHEQPYQNDWK